MPSEIYIQGKNCYTAMDGNGPYPWRNTTNVKDSPNDLVSSIQKDSIAVTKTDDTATYSSNEPASDISVSMVNTPASATDTSKPDTDFCKYKLYICYTFFYIAMSLFLL